MVKIDRGKPSFVASFASVEKSQWMELFSLKSAYLRNQVDVSAKRVIEAAAEAPDVYEALGFQSAEQMITEGYDLDIREVDHARKWLELSKADAPYREVVDAAVADAAIKPAGRPPKEMVVNDNHFPVDKNTATAMIRRLAREGHDELIEQVKSGEKSVNAAAIQAGFRKKQISIPVDDVEATAKRLRKHFSADQLAELSKAISG